MQRFFKNLYKFICVHLQYKSAIMNQLKIHDFITYFCFQTQIISM
jgi:hypothetical protein